MKNVKLSLFVTALTLAIAIPTGVYAQGNDVKTKSVEHKIECKTVKTQEWDAKFIKNHVNNKELSDKRIVCRDEKNQEWAKKYTKNHDKKVKCEDVKIKLSAEDKAALQVKKDAIKEVKIANKVLKTTIKTNKEAVKVELKRIKESNLTITPEIQATIDELLLTMKNEHRCKMNINCPEEIKTDVEKLEVTPVNAVVEPAIEVTPVVEPAAEVIPEVAPVVEATPVVEPVVDVTPVIVPVVEPVVEKTYIEKLKARLDNALVAQTAKNTRLTALSTKILSLLTALKLIV